MRFVRRYPAVLWLPIYLGSIFILNGGHPGWDPLELAIGIGLVLVASVAATYLALGPWPGHPQPEGMGWAFAGVLLFYAVCSIVAGAFAGPGAAIATLLAGAIPLAAVALWVAHARAKTLPEEDGRFADAAQEDEEPVPGIGLDTTRPMGDTPAAHDEMIPEDLPLDSPARRAAEEQAAELGGTTPGHAQGGAAGRDAPPHPDEGLVSPEESHEGAQVEHDAVPADEAEARRPEETVGEAKERGPVDPPQAGPAGPPQERDQRFVSEREKQPRARRRGPAVRR